MAVDALRWRHPGTISVLCTVADRDVPALRASLSRGGPALRVDELPTVHFLRMFVIDPDHDLQGRPLPARLVLSIVFDGTAQRVLEQWVELVGDLLVQILGRCDDGPARPADVLPFLQQRAATPDTFHIGPVGASVAQIREEERLANELRRFVDALATEGVSGISADEVRRRALTFVRRRNDLPQQPRPARPLLSRFLQAADLTGTAVIAACSAPLAGFGLGVVRYLERTEADVVIRQDDRVVEALESEEDVFAQNQFTMVAAVRDSTARRLMLRATLLFSDAHTKHFSHTGRLVGVETIHFARIHQIDGGRRLLFMSDFDGGWNRYLFDFLTTGAFAVVPNWTNLHGCPKTRYLFLPEPGFAQRFLPFTRARQLRTDVWFSAFPDLTVTDILKHAQIRAGLFSDDRPGAERWLRLL